MTFTLGHANIQQTDNATNEAATIDALFDRCDVVTWNEARDASRVLHGRPGWDSVTAGGLGISWDTSKFEKVAGDYETVMRGGHVGADGQPGGDDRRVGPSRGVLWVLLREKATGLLVLVATHHSVAKADTSAPWRRAIRARGWAGVVAVLRAVRAKHPSAAVLLTGDMNTIGRIVAFAGLGIREAATPATFGRRLRYDRIFGNVANIRTLATRSDHRALLASVSLDGSPAPLPDTTPGLAPATQQKPWGTRRQRRRLRRLERIARLGGRRLRAFQRRALTRLRALRRRNR